MVLTMAPVPQVKFGRFHPSLELVLWYLNLVLSCWEFSLGHFIIKGWYHTKWRNVTLLPSTNFRGGTQNLPKWSNVILVPGTNLGGGTQNFRKKQDFIKYLVLLWVVVSKKS